MPVQPPHALVPGAPLIPKGPPQIREAVMRRTARDCPQLVNARKPLAPGACSLQRLLEHIRVI